MLTPADGQPADQPIRRELVNLAAAILADGEDEQAFQIAAFLLSGSDPASAAPDLVLADAAVIHCHNPHAELKEQWARYARNTMAELRGPADLRTLDAAQLQGSLCCTAGRYHDAVAFWAALADGYDQQGMHADADRSRIETAGALYAAGRCREALTLAEHAWTRWTQHRYNIFTGYGIAYTYARMLATCGPPGSAEAFTNSADFGPLTDISRDLALLSGTTLDPDRHSHVCTQPHTGPPPMPPTASATDQPRHERRQP